MPRRTHARANRADSQNGAACGAAVKKSGVARDDVFVSTKLIASPDDADLLATSRKVVKDTGLDYVDCFLVHTPSCGPAVRERFWRALEELQREGLTRSIGVANYGVKHLEELRGYARKQPAVNQIELHPWLPQRDIVDYCRAHHIALEAYCPLVRGQKLDDATLRRIAGEVGKTPGHVLLRWSLQKGYLPLPKSDDAARIAANADLYDFELTDAHVAAIDALGDDERLALAPDNTRCP